MGLLLPVLPAYVIQLGASATQVGFLFAASAVAGIVVSVPAALLTARLGRPMLLIGAPATVALASVWCGLAGSFSTLAAFCIVEGGMVGAYATASTSAIIADARPQRSGRAIALYQGDALLGIAAGPALGGLIGPQHVRELFFTNAVGAALVASWLAARLGRDQELVPRPNVAFADSHQGHAHRRRFTSLAWLSLWLFVFAVAFAQVGTQWVAAPFLGARRLGLGSREIGLALALGGIAALGALYPAGWLSDHYGRKVAIVTGGLGTAAALGVLALSYSFAMFIASAVLLGVASALTGTAPAAHLAHSLRGERQAVGVGVYRTAVGLGSTFAPPFLGWWISRGDYSSALIASTALLLASTCAFAVFAVDDGASRVG